MKAAFAHRGAAGIDVISPCVTFADHEGSTKSYAYVKEHDAPLHSIDFVPHYEDIHVDYEPGSTHEVEMPDGSRIVLKKLGADYDPKSREGALQALETARRDGDRESVTSYHLYRDLMELQVRDFAGTVVSCQVT